MSDLQADIKTPSLTWQDIEHEREGGRAGLLPLMGFLKNAITHIYENSKWIVRLCVYTITHVRGWSPYSVAVWLAHRTVSGCKYILV